MTAMNTHSRSTTANNAGFPPAPSETHQKAGGQSKANVQRVIPEGAVTREYPDAKLTVYYYSRGDWLLALVFKGRQKKAKHHYKFARAESRDGYIARIIEDETRNEDFMRARKNAAHGLAVGDILFKTWGYEQTNATFYRVVRVPSSRSVAVVLVPTLRHENPVGSMSGWATPDLDAPFDPADGAIRRAVADGEVSAGKGDRGSLRKWHGRSVSISWYA